MPARTGPHQGVAETPLALRLALALAVPMIAALTVAGTYLGKEVVIAAGWLGLGAVAFLFVRPVVGVSVMSGAYLLAAYPTVLQALGVLTLNNLLGVGFVVLLIGRTIDGRDLSFLRVRQVILLLVIGVVFIASSAHSGDLFPLLQVSRGKRVDLDKTAYLAHDFITRLAFLIFYFSFVRSRRDLRTMFLTFMVPLYLAVPSALMNWMQGTLISGFRAAASLTSGANPNRLAMICLIEVACWWFWALSRPGLWRRLIAYGAIGSAIVLVFATGSRSGLLGVGVLGVVLQTGPRRFRIPTAQIAAVVVVGLLVIPFVIPAEAWERSLNFFPTPGTHGMHSTMQREDTLRVGAQMVGDHPLLGIGLGNFREVSRQIYLDPYYRPPHNSYLWAAAEGGLPTLALYLVLFWMTWRDLGVIMRLSHRDPEIGYIAIAMRTAFIIYNFFALFADLWTNPITYILIGQIITMRRYVESLPEPAPAAAVRRLGRPTLAVA